MQSWSGKPQGASKTYLTLSKDASGRECVSVSHQRQTKNHRGDVHDKDQKQGRMYDKPCKNFSSISHKCLLNSKSTLI